MTPTEGFSVADQGLSTHRELVGFTRQFATTRLQNVPQFELLAVAIPSWARQKSVAQIGPLPNPGQSSVMPSGQHLLWTGVGQYYAYCETSAQGEAAMNARLEGAGYVTDVSDGWVSFDLQGVDAQTRLDLITLPDLSDDTFQVGAVTSTVIAHLRVLIWRRAEDHFVLLTAASSARSFIHHLNEDLALFDTVSERLQ